MRIGLFIPCFIDAFAPEVSIATLELLERVGLDVIYPRDQTCCAQPMANAVAVGEPGRVEIGIDRTASALDLIEKRRHLLFFDIPQFLHELQPHGTPSQPAASTRTASR
jgi:hypothetical protein